MTGSWLCAKRSSATDYVARTCWRGASGRWLEGGGVDCGFSAFDGDAFDFYGLGEDGFLEAVGQDFQDVAYLGRPSAGTQNMHGLGVDVIHTYESCLTLGLFFDGVFCDSFFHAG